MAEIAPHVEARPSAPHGPHGHAESNWFIKYCWSTDHKIISLQYMFTGMCFAMVAGFMAYVFRMQIAYPGMNVPFFGHVSADAYNAFLAENREDAYINRMNAVFRHIAGIPDTAEPPAAPGQRPLYATAPLLGSD